MVVKVKSFFKVEMGGATQVKVHNTLTPEYISLLQGLLTQGQGYTQSYSYYTAMFEAPSFIYIVLLNQGTVVARLLATLGNFNEQINVIDTNTCQNNLTSCNLNSLTFQLQYEATDESNDSYTFDEIQIWADNSYAIAHANVGSVTKDSNSFIRVTWEAMVTITSNGVLYIPGCTNFSLTLNSQLNIPNFYPLLCLNIPYIITAITLIPYHLIPPGTFLSAQLSALLRVLNIPTSPYINVPGIPIQRTYFQPIQLLYFEGVRYYVIDNTAYPISQPFTLQSNTVTPYPMSQSSTPQPNIVIPYPISQLSIFQPNTVTLFLLYGINNNYFIYTTYITVNLQYSKRYIPVFTINIIEE